MKFQKLALLFLGLLLMIVVTRIKIVFLKSESVSFRVCMQVYNLRPEKGDLCAFNFRGRRFVKYMVGVAGDEIRYVGKVIYVGTTKVGEAKKTDLLTPIPEGRIPESYVFVAGTHPDSLDSRYKEFGLVKETDVRGKVFGLVKHKK
ncbi:MAG: S26 family signal peptidase [Holosporaceae bacterium]|jgi:conjugal transfer pilin signal peptidase TrbI|nr:S26 family signal peptidase [Holosporaceae bacterium]